MESDKFNTDKAPKPVGLYPHSRKVGNLLFLSGVGPRIANSNDNDSSVPGLKLDHNGNFLAFEQLGREHKKSQDLNLGFSFVKLVAGTGLEPATFGL